ncbi:hypothetical protein EDD21DRAFT_417227 [Dissophora ornata]|nr:hypothetical protein EDD21DRAFT_417227 [Dissophora ornata]
MALFKSSKNQSASATTTPRSSMNEQRPVQVIKMTQDQALEMLHKKAMPNASAGPFILLLLNLLRSPYFGALVDNWERLQLPYMTIDVEAHPQYEFLMTRPSQDGPERIQEESPGSFLQITAGLSLKRHSKKNSNNNPWASVTSTPSISRRNSTHDNRARLVKSDKQIRDEMMQIVMSKCILVHPSQPFVL